ncbi:MAG: VWA domain-containing protein [Planctomycetota bacterium]
MATESATERRTRGLAWAASLAAHSLLTATLVWGGSRGGIETGGDAPQREIGIVLRESSQPPSPFETDSVVDSEVTEPTGAAPTEAADDRVAVAPNAFSDLLTQLVETAPPGSGPPASAGGSASAPQPPMGGGRPKLPIGQTRVPFYGVEGVGSRFVFLLDRSYSMRGGPLRSAKAELIESLGAIGPTHQFHIVFFNTRVSPVDVTGRRRVARGTDEDKRRAIQMIQSVSAEGGTVGKETLDFAIRKRPDVVFFLTDGDLPMTAAELAEVIGDAAGSITIHTVEFGKGPDHGRRNVMVALAEGTGGERCYVDTTLLPR